MFDLTPFDRRRRSLANYFNDLEKDFFGDMGNLFPSFNTDILDKGDKYVLEAELPGFNKEDIKIDIDGDRLMIQAEHKEDIKNEKDNYVKQERRYGSFSRSFDISGIKADEISAKYNNGILELTLPKKEPEKKSPTRRIDID